MRPAYLIAFLAGTNVMLLALYLSARKTLPEPAEESAGRVVFDRSREQTNAAAPPPATVQLITNRFEWAQLESEDYETYIARLRSIGCPEQTIRDIIIADVEKLMAGRMHEIEGPSEPPKYWKASEKDLVSTVESLQKLAQKQELDFEKRKVLQQLLGIDLAAERLAQRGEQDFYAQRLSFLPLEKQAQVRMTLEKANREEVLLREQSWVENDELTAEERARLLQMQADKEQALSSILTPVEMEQFNLWFSPSAYKVREAFAGLDSSEEEFLAIYDLQRKFDFEWGGVDAASLPADERQRYEIAERELQNSFRVKLGEDRFAEYRRAQDPDFRKLREAAAQFNLPAEIARDVYGFKELALEQRSRVQENLSISPADREVLLNAISEETEQAVVEALGPRAYRYYIRAGAGKWINE